MENAVHLKKKKKKKEKKAEVVGRWGSSTGWAGSILQATCQAHLPQLLVVGRLVMGDGQGIEVGGVDVPQKRHLSSIHELNQSF